MKKTLVRLLVFGAAVAAPGTSSAAEIPACPASETPALELVAPAQAVVGRPTVVWLRYVPGVGAGKIYGSVTASAADPARPISYPRTIYVEGAYSAPTFLPGTFTVGAADGPVLLSAQWDQPASLPQPDGSTIRRCRLSAQAVVTGKAGIGPSVMTAGRQYTGLRLTPSWPVACTEAAAEPLVLDVRATGQVAKVTSPAPCDLLKEQISGAPSAQESGQTAGKRFKITTDGSGPLIEALADDKSTVRRVDWTISSGGRPLAAGKFWAKTTPGDYRTIWEDEDDFVNVCINQTVQIRKSGGRLYCDEETEAIVTHFFKKKPKRGR